VTVLCDSGDKYLSERFWQEGEPDGEVKSQKSN